jgi:hypothetical protein
MESRRGRRSFLGLLGVGTSGSLLLALGQGAGAQSPQAGSQKKGKRETFRGTSNQGNLQEALDLAIQAAQKAAPGADRRVEWTLKEVSGREGGFAPVNEVTVTIEASFS